jgi:signal transduction histidine kinase
MPLANRHPQRSFAGRLSKQQNGGGELLAQIATASRDLVDSMSDIVSHHSRCTRAEIELGVAHQRILLRNPDSGRGFDPDGEGIKSRNGNGLASMRECARAAASSKSSRGQIWERPSNSICRSASAPSRAGVNIST